MDTNKPMALRLADKYEHEGFLSDHKFAQNQWCSHAAVELRRLHSENEALSNKLQTFEALGGAVDDLQLLRMGYAAARLEIETHKKHAAIAAKTLETYKQSGMDFAARVHALERAADNLREENASLQQRDDDWHKEHSNALVEIAILKAAKADARHDTDDLMERDESQRLRIAELEAQLAAIGAGGVEPMRKRECLHHVAEQAQIDSEVQRDAERYRWLRNMNDWHAEPRIEDADGTKWQLTFYTPQIIEDQSDDNNLDSAIDAARAD